MDTFLALLFLACLGAMIVGLIKPSWVIKWGNLEKRNRKNVLLYYGIAMIGLFICICIFASNEVDANTKAVEIDSSTSIDEIEEEQMREDVQVTEEVNEEDEYYDNWFNSGIESVLNIVNRLDELYSQLGELNQNQTQQIGDMYNTINDYYTKVVINVGSDISNDKVNKELSTIYQNVKTQAMELKNMSKNAVDGKWDKFSSNNDMFKGFRNDVGVYIKELIMDNQDIIAHSVLTKFEEIYGVNLDIEKSELEEGTTDVEYIEEIIVDAYDKDTVKNISLVDGKLILEVRVQDHQMGIDMDKMAQPTMISDFTELFADIIKTDVKEVEISIYSLSDVLKSTADLEVEMLTNSQYGKYWESLYIEDNMSLGEYYN